jgi:hypothetical protein
VALGFCSCAQSYRGVYVSHTFVSFHKWLWKKIKINKEAINEILVADTDSESVTEASDVEYKLKEVEENNNNNNNSTSSRQNH